jgi:regulator of protease activity HflC (stomatin/prohibitin superfamily)
MKLLHSSPVVLLLLPKSSSMLKYNSIYSLPLNKFNTRNNYHHFNNSKNQYRFLSSSTTLLRSTSSSTGGGNSSSVGGGNFISNFGIAIVPQQRAFVVERFGRFRKILEPGLHFLIPFVDRVAYAHSLKEEAISIASQQAVTRDNVTLSIDGILYVRVIDPYKASYGVENLPFAVASLAQTTMRSELGKMTLDKTFEERENLNQNIVNAINLAAKPWGVECLRYEIRDVLPPPAVRNAMDLQAEAERRKRASVLQSEGDRQSDINRADGEGQAAIIRADAEAETIRRLAQATAEGLKTVGSAIQDPSGRNAASLRVAEKYVEAFSKIAKQGNSIVIPANVAEVGGAVAAAMGIFGSVSSASGNNFNNNNNSNVKGISNNQSTSSSFHDEQRLSSSPTVVDQQNQNKTKIPSIRDLMS